LLKKAKKIKRQNCKKTDEPYHEIPLEEKKMRASLIQKILDRLFPNPQTPLNYFDPFSLLCAAILSAQTTDGKVNEVTKEFFFKYLTPSNLSSAPFEEVLNVIRPVGLAPTKARYLIDMSKKLCQDFDGKVPNNLEDLESLPGVGRKTASVVLCTVFDYPALPVDTHILRLAVRWKLSSSKNPKKVERDLTELFPEKSLGRLHLQLIYFGREYCQARNHSVNVCPVCCWASIARIKDIPTSPEHIPQIHLKSPSKASKQIILYSERLSELKVENLNENHF